MRGLSENSATAKQIADKLFIPIILDGGALLGQVRDGKPIKGDEDDVDFAVPYWVAQFKMKEIIEAFTAEGFELFRLRDTVMTFKRNGSKVDFLFYKEMGEFYYLTLYHLKAPFALKVPKVYWDNLSQIKFLGTTFACPVDVKDYLTWRFGDWETPILRPAFSFVNYLSKPYLTCWL